MASAHGASHLLSELMMKIWLVYLCEVNALSPVLARAVSTTNQIGLVFPFTDDALSNICVTDLDKTVGEASFHGGMLFPSFFK